MEQLPAVADYGLQAHLGGGGLCGRDPVRREPEPEGAPRGAECLLLLLQGAAEVHQSLAAPCPRSEGRAVPRSPVRPRICLLG